MKRNMRIRLPAIALMIMAASSCMAQLPAMFTNGAGSVMYKKTTGVIVAPEASVLIASNGIATVAAMNASNVLDRAYTLGLVTNASVAASNYTDAAISNIPPSGLTNGVGSGCTVTTTGKTFYVSVVAPTGTAASVDADLQDHKTNATAHSALFSLKLDITATNGAECGSHAGFANQTNGLASTSYVAQVVGGYLPTNTTLGISATEGTNIASAVIAPYTNHQSRTDNPHGVTAGQAGALPTGTVYVAVEADTNALYQLGVHTNLGSGSLHVSAGDTNLIAKAWQNPISATNWTWTKTATAVTLTGYSGPNAVVIPDTLDNLPVTGFGTIFAGVAITSISGGANVTSIGVDAFLDCLALANVHLPFATSIRDSAFYGCEVLTNVNLTSATSIGEGAFIDCFSITSISLPSATSVGHAAFRYCTALTSVYFGQNAPTDVGTIYEYAPNVTNYVTSSTATGWGATWNGRPVVRLPLYGSSANLTGLTPAQVAAAGGLTNIVISPILTPTALATPNGTGTIDSTSFYWNLGPITSNIVVTIGPSMTNTTQGRGFWLDFNKGSNSLTFDPSCMTNYMSTVAASNAYSTYWHAGVGQTNFAGNGR